MSMEYLLIFLAVGVLAGFIAGHIWKGKGFGLLGDLIIGVIGSFIGVWLFGLFHISSSGILGLLIAAIIGALILLYLIRQVKHH
ncbi:MAG: GlsB/YeaQ/YmgE family stress response membrane protein [candidate division KSB1 bacterium]|nr:GlsB/YeaQ/YmgE family stress response membrane protein [candidate division KSB1 bacterium]